MSAEGESPSRVVAADWVPAERYEALERELAALTASRAALAEALRLPIKWSEAVDKSLAASDEVLKAHGWDGKLSPDEFMQEYARAALAEHGGEK